MEDITLQELKAQDGERLLLSSNPSWQEELAASRREHDRIIARLERSMDILDHLRRFPRFFREHWGKKVFGVLAAIKIPSGLRKRALRQGLYLATIRDDVFDVLRPEGFEPRVFPN